MDEQDEGGARWDEKDGRKWGKTLSSLWSQPLSWGALRGLALSSAGKVRGTHTMCPTPPLSLGPLLNISERHGVNEPL